MATSEEVSKVSHLDFNQLANLAFGFGTKIDGLWQRIVYIHIGMVAAVLFLARADQPYYAARAIVLGFYTFNIVITHLNMRDSYKGLQRVIDDLNRFPSCPRGGTFEDWLKQRRYSRNAQVRAAVLLLFWCLVAYLLLVPVFNIPGLDSIIPFNDALINATPRKTD